MHIEIQFRGLDVSPAVREHAERRARFTLGRHSGQISRVSISLADINGPKGGEDKSCTVQIRLQQSEPVVVVEQGLDLHQVIDRGLARAGRSVVRRVDRQARQRFSPRSERPIEILEETGQV